MRLRPVTHALVLAIVLASTSASWVSSASLLTPDELQAFIVERAEAWRAVPSRVLAIARCETGNKWRTDLIGAAGELGVGQWLARGAWYGTPHYRVQGIDVRQLYQSNHPDAYWWDVDGLAWAFSPEAPPGFGRQWSCA